ncbi:hypothetical protein [Halobacillus seohaensis]|uniref:Uncharacterized protein n=1 Tax=Halobacillus seohaensis TaxID=447421 RepID=A0ABW2EL94_9BACI
MNNLDNYLKQDIEQAAQETRRFWNLANKLQAEFTQGDMEACKQTAFNMIQISNELEWLQERKQNNNQLSHLVARLNQKGIVAAKVEWLRED